MISVSLALWSLQAWIPPAVAQQTAGPGRGAWLPVSLDLRKVADGSWAEYATTYAGMKTRVTERLALVARTGATVEIESASPEMDEEPAGRKTLRTRLSISDTEIKLVEQTIQWMNGDQRSEHSSADPEMGSPFRRPDPKTRIGVESVTVPAGVFPKAEHYRVQLGPHETLDFWTSPDAPPLGLVKVVIKGSAGLFSGSTKELIALGTGAKPAIVPDAKRSKKR